jgi:hypothetical protein
MSYWNNQIDDLWNEWMAETGQSSGDPDEFIEWAMRLRKLALRPQDAKKLLRKQVTQALRQSKKYDVDGGFTYRSKQSVTLFDGGSPVKHYFDTDSGGTPTLRQKSVSQRREGIAHDVYRAVCDVERMNKVFPNDHQLSFVLNFADDFAELRAAELMERDEEDDDD